LIEDSYTQLENFNGLRCLIDKPYNRNRYLNIDMRFYSWKDIRYYFFANRTVGEDFIV